MSRRWNRQHQKSVPKAKGVDKTVNSINSSSHPLLRAGELGGANVRWLTNRKGRALGWEFLNENTKSKAGLLSLIAQIAVSGRVSNIPQRGRKLREPFSEIWELKPGPFRYMGFFHNGEFYITNGAPKKTGRQQNVDYSAASRLRLEFLGDTDG